MRNLNVIACNETDGFYYPGIVSRPLDEDTVTVKFYDIKRNRVPCENVIHIGGAIPWPDLQVGDYALVRVMCRTSRVELYVPGVVVVLPNGRKHETRFYTLRLYNGRFIEKLRRNIVKVGPEKYKEIFEYIAQLRYGMLRRTITLESVQLNRYPAPRLKRSFSSSSFINLYPSNNDKFKIRQLHDDSKKRWIQLHDDSKKRWIQPKPLEKNRKGVLMESTETLRSVDSLRSDRSDRRCQSIRRTSKHKMPRTQDIERDLKVTQEKVPATVLKNNSGEKSSKTLYPQASMMKRTKPKEVKTISRRSSTTSIVSNISDRSVVPKRVLQAGLEVLARWSDDGWYYWSVVVRKDGDSKYFIRDSTGYTESIWMENILLGSDSEFCIIQPFDHVIALHPNYVFSYAPGIVTEVYNSGFTVVFYDQTQHKLPKSEVYKIKHSKYKRDVEYIKNQENGWRNSVVIARNDENGYYQKCEIVCPEGVRQKFIVSWPREKGELTRQVGNHIFPAEAGSQSAQKSNWKYALVPADETMSLYLPAEVIKTNPFTVKIFFGNEQRVKECKLRQCFWLNKAYYDNAVNFINCLCASQEEYQTEY